MTAATTARPEVTETPAAAAPDPRGRLVARGGTIFREGDEGGFAYMVESGSVEIVRGAMTPSETVLAILAPGTLFGEMALIDQGVRSATARAIEDSRIVEIDRASFLHYIATNPNVAYSIMTRLSANLRRANDAVRRGDDGTAVPLRLETARPSLAVDDGAVVADTDALAASPVGGGALRVAVAVLVATVLTVSGLSMVQVERTVGARGRLTPADGNVQVQAPTTGVIAHVDMERGRTVRAGHTIMRLDPTFANANLSAVSARLAATETRLSRYQAERGTLAGRPLPETLDPVSRAILETRMAERTARLASFEARLGRIERERASKIDEIRLTGEQLAVKRQVERAKQELRVRENVSLLSYLEAVDDRLEAERRYEAARTALEHLAAERQTVVAERSAFEADWQSRLVENEIREDEVRIQLVEEVVKAQRALDDLEIRAPADGIVLDLPRLTRGSVLRQGDPVVTLVRLDSPLVVEVDVDPRDIGELRPGIPVSVKLDALPAQRFGDLAGRVAWVSTDSVDGSVTGDRGTFFRARVELLATAPAGAPPGFRVTPGLQAKADMVVGARSVLGYLVDPILQSVSGAFAEPR